MNNLEKVTDMMDEISNTYYNITKLLDYNTKSPYLDVDHYITACCGETIHDSDNSIIVKNLKNDWNGKLLPIKEENREFMKNAFGENTNASYSSGYLEGFLMAGWAHKKIQRIIDAPIITGDKHGKYLETGIFETDYPIDNLAYPNEKERELHISQVVTSLKTGNFSDYSDIMEMYQEY